MLIRVFGGFPEGVSFAILIMNCCAWMFDKHTQRRQFGVSREDVNGLLENIRAMNRYSAPGEDSADGTEDGNDNG